MNKNHVSLLSNIVIVYKALPCSFIYLFIYSFKPAGTHYPGTLRYHTAAPSCVPLDVLLYTCTPSSVKKGDIMNLSQ